MIHFHQQDAFNCNYCHRKNHNTFWSPTPFSLKKALLLTINFNFQRGGGGYPVIYVGWYPTCVVGRICKYIFMWSRWVFNNRSIYIFRDRISLDRFAFWIPRENRSRLIPVTVYTQCLLYTHCLLPFTPQVWLRNFHGSFGTDSWYCYECRPQSLEQSHEWWGGGGARLYMYI